MEQEAWGKARDRFIALTACWQELSRTVDSCDSLIAGLLQDKTEAPAEGAAFLSAPSVALGLDWPDAPFAVEGARDICGHKARPDNLELGDKVPLLKVATLLDGARRQVQVKDLALRKGRFSYLDSQSQWQPFDDYTTDTTVLLLGAFCNIRSPQGSFATLLAEGKLSFSTLFHVLEGANPQETRYLRHCLAATPAANYLRGTNISERLELEGLSSILVPYPALQVRLAFTRVMDLIEQELINLPGEILTLLALGDGLYRRACIAGGSGGSGSLGGAGGATSRLGELAELRAGSFCALDEGAGLSSVPVVSPRGIIARTAEALVDTAALVMGSLGPWLSLRYLGIPSAPNAETAFIGAPDSQLPLPTLFFALRACGAVYSTAETGAQQARQGLTLEHLPGLELELPDARGLTVFAEQARALLTLVAALEQRREILRELRWLLNRGLLEGSLPVSLAWGQPLEGTGRWAHGDSDGPGDGASPAADAGFAGFAADEHPPLDSRLAADEGSTNGGGPADGRGSADGGSPAADDLPPEYAELPAAILDLAFGILEEAVERGIAKEALQLSFPPPNQARWLNGPLDPADPRWVFGPPPATRANYAWIQQVISAMGEASLAVVLLCNAALHSEHPGERPLREALAASGLVKAVIALPGQLFADGRPPSSLLVLEKGPHSRPGTLFVDLQEAGLVVSAPNDEALRRQPARSRPIAEAIPGSDPNAAGDCGGRVLPSQAVVEALRLYRSYTARGALPPGRGGTAAAVVDLATISAHDSLLAPWAYARPDEQAPKKPSTTEALALYRELRKNTVAEFHGFLGI
jgi:hypothetical protein